MSKVKPDKFIQLWIEAYNKNERIQWLAATMGVSEQTVHSLARACRRQGVELPSLTRTFSESIDVKAMNELIKKQLS